MFDQDFFRGLGDMGELFAAIQALAPLPRSVLEMIQEGRFRELQRFFKDEEHAKKINR